MDKWLNKPDSSDWYWFAFKGGYGKYNCKHIDEITGDYAYFESGRYRILISDYKWCKAIVPEFKE